MATAGVRRGRIDPRFMDEIRAVIPSDSRLEACIQCGTCGGSCPSAADMQQTPRQLFAMIRAGLRDEVLASRTPWMCVSCYLCAVRCPQEVHIPDVMYGLKALATREGSAPSSTPSAFSRTFVANIHRYGRSFEVGLVAQHYLRHGMRRLPQMAPMGIGMLARRRIGLRPHRIRDVSGLRAIMASADELASGRFPASTRADTPATAPAATGARP
jgi:quinone-modifying oxidoreductase, subunit QmoC